MGYMQIKEEILEDFFLYYNSIERAINTIPKTANTIISLNNLPDLSFKTGPNIKTPLISSI